MKNIFKPLIFTALAAMFVVACKKNNYSVDVDPLQPGSFAKFNVKATPDTAATYYIKNNNATWNIPIGITDVSSVDRVINLCYTSNKAVQGVQYNAPTSITIKAGETLDTLRVQGLFSGYPLSSRIDTVYIKICGGDVPASSYWSNYRLIMRKYCDVDLTALNGTYANTRESYTNGSNPYGPYATVVKNLTMVAGSTTKAEGFVQNIYNDGWVDIKIQLDWTDPAAFKATIPLQPTGKNYGGAPTSVRSHSGKANTFSSCEQSFLFTIQLTNAAGTSIIDEDYQIKINKP
jgi:hypothetical protein